MSSPAFLVRFRLSVLAVVASALPLSACIQRQGMPGPTWPEVARTGEAPIATPSTLLRPRAQHTLGGAGESLFPAPMPDGTGLYYASSLQGPGFAIVRQSLGATAVAVVTSGPWSDIHPSLSPDGRRLAFVSNRDGGWSLYLKEGDASPDRRLTAAGSDAFGPSWSPDSRRIAYFRAEPRGGFAIWVLEVEGGKDSRLGPGLFPSWSAAGPGGEWIAYQLAREHQGQWYSIWKMRPDGSHPTLLVLNEGWGAIHPTWSPDGKWIAFAAVGKGAAPGAIPGGPARDGDLYLMTGDGQRLMNLTGDRPGVAEWNPSFSRDGRLYFNSDQGGGVNIWSLDPGTGLHEGGSP